MAESKLFKDRLGRPEVEKIADAIEALHPAFPRSVYVSQAINGLSQLELKARVRHIIEALRSCLPADFEDAAKILYKLPDGFDPGGADHKKHHVKGFTAWPLIDYVGIHGTNHPDVALPLLKRLTPMFSAEFAIRPFIRDDPESTFRELETWLADPDHHVRRLVSEGTRPRLPWGMRLKALVSDPAPILPLLNALKDDSSEFVRRSVANNLNDIAKDHPDLVISICEGWSRGADESRRRLIRRALRTLIKSGHRGVFPLLGFTANPNLEIGLLEIANDRISLGGVLEFELKMRSLAASQRFVVDFAIHFVKANGKTSPKVFKLRNIEARRGEAIVVRKKHPLKRITTRRYYPGEHILAIHINGREVARATFILDT